MSDRQRKPWGTISRDRVFECAHYTLLHDRFVLPSGKEHDYYFVHTNGSALCIATNAERKYALVRQFRYLLQRNSLEFPCGGMKENETPVTAAQREFEEETQYGVEAVQEIGTFSPFNGMADELCYVCAGTITGPATGITKNEEQEITTVEWYTGEEIDKMIKNHTLWDGMTIAAWHLNNLHNT